MQQFGADWVGPLDADEFVEPQEGTTLAGLLAARDAVPLALCWSNFVWPPEGDPGDELNPEVVRYLNRLSDLLFILSRGANRGEEPLWEPGKYR